MPINVINSGGRSPGLGVFGSEAADRISVDLANRQYVIQSPAGFATQDCAEDSSSRVVCSQLSQRFVADLLGGDDVLHLQGDAGGRFLRGGAGADLLVGSVRANALVGDTGRDRLRGRAGDDRLLGGGSSDILAGGSGGDFLDAVDGLRDSKVKCGSGTDFAVIDRDLDPRPVGCETIRARQPRP